MKKTTNITCYSDDLNRYHDACDLRSMTERFGLDGLEVMPALEKPPYSFLKGQVIGVHLCCQSDWVALWKGNTDLLNFEYGSPENWKELYGGTTREALLASARRDLDYAREQGAEYVVFHISNVRPSEVFTGTFYYQDEEVIDASVELINELLDGRDDSFCFLMENLWWPGMRLNDPSLTRRLLSGVHYANKGIMLDVGHFFHTHPELQTQREGVSCLKEMLSQHEDLLPYFRGIHLHQTLSGSYLQKLLLEQPPVPADPSERFGKAMEHIFAIDRHLPFTDPSIQEVLDWICPEYLTMELISQSRKDHEKKLKQQTEALRF